MMNLGSEGVYLDENCGTNPSLKGFWELLGKLGKGLKELWESSVRS